MTPPRLPPHRRRLAIALFMVATFVGCMGLIFFLVYLDALLPVLSFRPPATPGVTTSTLQTLPETLVSSTAPVVNATVTATASVALPATLTSNFSPFGVYLPFVNNGGATPNPYPAPEWTMDELTR